MSVADLGEPLTAAYSIPGGQARLYERGLTVDGAGGLAIVAFAFPMIGRPSVVTGNATPLSPFGPEALPFRLDNWKLGQLATLIRNALGARLCLVPTGQPAVQVPLTIGPEDLLKPERPGGPGGITIPAVYGISVSVTALQERQLYDVAVLADGGERRVVAPHAVYHRQAWTDFGIAHITDVHVARRIDGFRDILVSAGRAEAAGRMYNWNDRFRGFVKYANYLHGIGVLDVIVATGDVYDFLLEDDDDPSGGGNPAFLRKLVLGQAPGPDFPDVEELRVPIFMTPGNHDYRKHPYKHIFDLKIHIAGIPKDVHRFDNYSPYNLPKDDAVVLTNHLDGRTVSTVPNLSPAAAARMVEVDAEIKPFKTFLADGGSYVVQLGPHRLAMVDSAHDVGIVTELIKGAWVALGFGTEDEQTFVSGSPNCKGVEPGELAIVSDALNETPPDALFIVGVHAPLINMWNDEYPYFLRETQRQSHAVQAHAFLARHDKAPVLASQEPEEQIEKRHPLWFPEDDHRRTPDFVKRGGYQDFLDFGVSRGHAEDLTQRLAGVGSGRSADVVLAGHTHLHNEFRVGMTPSGELAYYMDFYTQNPARYYPTRFTTSWQALATQPATIQPVTAKTYVDVVPGAARDGTPWPMPYDDSVENQLQVPPYPNPLSAAPDPRAWWAEHRPLILQTGALGPLKVLSEFAGFRLLSVKRDVIDKIHFVSIEKLEASHFRLAWEDAIRADPPRRYLYLQRSLRHHAPEGAGAPTGIVFPALAVNNVVYRDEEGRLHELWQKGSESGTSNLTELADNAIRADGDPTSYLDTTDGLEVALYRGTDGHVHSLYWSTGRVGRDALSATAGAPKVAAHGKPAGFVQTDGTNVVVYRAADQHLHSLWWTGTNAPGTEDLSNGQPLAAGDPTPFVNTRTGRNLVAYRGTDGHVYLLYWTGIEAVRLDDLSGVAGASRAAGDLAAYYIARDDAHQVIYRGENGHLHELWWIGDIRVSHTDLTTAAPGAPPARSDPAAYYNAGTNTKHVIYRSADGHLNDIWWVPGGVLTHIDLTVEALAPPAADRPFDTPAAFCVEGPNTQHAVYRGADRQVHEIRWTVDQPLQITGVTDDGSMWHTIRHADRWDGFGDVRSQAGHHTPPFKTVSCAAIDGELHVCGVTSDGGMWHAVRRPGSWIGFGDVRGVAGHHTGAFKAVGCAGVNGELQVCGITEDGGMWHAVRRANGSWIGFGDVKSQAGHHTGPFKAVGCAGINGELHVCGVTDDGAMWHCIRRANGSWIGFGDVKGQAGHHTGPFNAVGCAEIDRELQVCGVTNDGGMWHTIRHADQWDGFGDVKGQAGRHPGQFTAVGCAAVNSELQLCGVTNDGGMWHTIRHADRWDGFGDVKGQAGNPGRFLAIAGAGLS
jgi:hypothetical protein